MTMQYPSQLVDALSSATVPTAADRLLVSEQLTTLEAACAIDEPAFSPLLDGEWEVVYSGGVSPGPVLSPTREIALLMYAGGFTPGSFFLSVAGKLPESLVHLSKPKITIQATQPRVTAAVTATAFGTKQELLIRANLQVESSKRLRETYEEADLGGNVLAIPELLKWERLLFVTYLDMNVMVVRDETGAPDILVRKSEVQDTVTRTDAAAPALTSDDDDEFVTAPDNVITTEYEM